MTLPATLKEAIDTLIEDLSLKSLTQASREVSARYRGPREKQNSFLTSDAHRMAYLTTRLPATYEAIHATLRSLAQQVPSFKPTGLLDMGAGPGTAMWASVDVFPSIETFTLVEKDPSFMDLGRKLAQQSQEPAIRKANWMQGDMAEPMVLPAHDLVLFSYSIGELPAVTAQAVLKACWDVADRALLVIEPGTPRGYATIMDVRRALIGWGGRIVAPCPHADRCPMEGTKDWCHFACRVARSSAHRQVKEATMGHEDEKFSYIVATKGIGQPVQERIVRHPLRRSGHVHLELCTQQGLQSVVLSKKNGEAYQWARKASWGDGR